MQDENTKFLQDVCLKLEDGFDIADKSSSAQPIEAILRPLSKSTKNITDEQRASLSREAFSLICMVSYMTSRMDFFSYTRLDFSSYPHKADLREALKGFVSRSSLGKNPAVNIKKNLNTVIDVLDTVDRKHLELKFELPYRYLRILAIFLMCGVYTEASVISRMLLSQIERGN